MVQGIEKIREKLPGYEGNKIGLLGALAPIMISIGLGFQLFMDVVPRIFPQIQLLTQLEPIFPILGSMVIASIGLTLLTRLWRKRIEMQEKYGDLAYQKILPSGFSGAWLQMSVLLHGLFSVRSLPPGPPVNDLTISFSRSILPILGVPNEIDIILRISLATIIVVLGILTIARAITELGLDTGLLVYVYFPEESEFKEHAIYSVIRHPAYFGVLLLVVSFCALRLSLYSLTLFVILYICFKIHIHVEEGELLERFGEGYKEYMSRIPGLYVSPRNIGTYFRFLRGPN